MGELSCDFVQMFFLLEITCWI